MNDKNPHDRFKNYLIKKDENSAGPEKRCWFCQKSEDEIKQQYYDIKFDPTIDDKDFNIEDLIFMTYKLSKPICAACYFSIRNNPDLVQEVYDNPVEDVWE